MKKSSYVPAILAAIVLLCVSSCAGSPRAGGGKPVILAVSFGTSFNETRAKTIGAIEKTLAQQYPDYEVRRAFTSQIVIDHINERDGEKIDNVEEAMQRLVQDKVTHLVVQSTLIMPGAEYDESMASIKAYEKNFASVSYGLPLLISDRDFETTATALIENFKQYNVEDTAVIFMGHGTHHEANQVYSKLDALLKSKGAARFYLATVEGAPVLDDVVVQLKLNANVKKVILAPFMIVAGDHANNDMAGSEDDSWKSILEAEGYEVTPLLKGLGEYPEMQRIFVQHSGEAMGS